MVETRFEGNLVFMEIPHFWHHAVIDPDYSVLLGDRLAQDEDSLPDGCLPKRKNRVGVYIGMKKEGEGIF